MAIPGEDAGERAPGGIDTSRPSIARVYDHLLDGKDNFAADRAVGERIKAAVPEIQMGVREQRAVLGRVIRFLVGEVGIRQLIDIGAGLPTAGNVHEIAQEVVPETRVVYVDNDPVVLAHARALLAGDHRTIVVDRDLRRPDDLLDDPDLRAHIDFERPVGLLLCGVLHYLTDDEDPAGIIARLVERLPAGSHVFVHHLVPAGTPGEEVVVDALRQSMARGQFRTPDEVRDLMAGLDLVEPGLVLVPEWRPEGNSPSPADHPAIRLAVAAVGRKP